MLLAGLVVLLLGAVAAAEPGVLVTSDGERHEGDVTWTKGQPLRVFDEKANKWYSLEEGEILRLRSIVTNEEEEKAWVWVEDGRQEKIFTGETYPIRDIATEVTLRTGAVYRGECRAVLYVRDDAGRKTRFFLKSRWQGERGQKQKDLVHVEEVLFEGAAEGPADRPSLLLRLSGLGEIEAVHAIERVRDLHFEARRTPDGWLLAGLLPGRYDLAVVGKEGVRLWLQAEPETRRTLPPEDEAAVAARVGEVEDFFPVHRTLAAFGGHARTRALVLKERTGATSMSAEGERLFRRLEIWTLHHHGERWYVDGRVMLYREHGDPFDLAHARPVEEDPRLGGIEAASGRRTVELDLATAARDGEEPHDGR